MVLAQPGNAAVIDPDEQFPSHYGSRSTSDVQSVNLINKIRFHPTMVLAQLILHYYQRIWIQVSIPLSQLMHFDLT